MDQETLFKAGQGNWGAFKKCGLDLGAITGAAESWRDRLRGHKRPWLCWHIDDDWTLVQQRLVSRFGWTPVIGFDPRIGAPRHVMPDAIVIDFNSEIKLPVMYPHFPLEFAFLFVEERLAFWHSDLVIRQSTMEGISRIFTSLKDGETAATWKFDGWRSILSKSRKRYWELVGCTTPLASKDQFDKGTGWWMEFWEHPNCPPGKELNRRKQYYWDHGTGIYYWHKFCRGKLIAIDAAPIEEGHCTKINNPSYKRSWADVADAQREMAVDIRANFDLVEVCRKLDLEALL